MSDAIETAPTMPERASALWQWIENYLEAECGHLPEYLDEPARSNIRNAIANTLASEWQDISTAPKDGKTYIYAYPVLSQTPCVVVWELPVSTPPMMRAKGENIDHDGYWRLPMTGKPTPYRPTHWMPLPTPPKDPTP